MAFTIVYKGQTISATDFNDNFYHIAQGNLLPRGGNSLEATTGVYDLGSISYNWNNVHVQNVNLNGELQNAMNLIAEVTLTATSSVIDITGLNGEADEIYEVIVLSVLNTIGSGFFYFNGDSATNYGFQYFLAIATTTIEYRGVINSFYIGYVDTATARYSKSNFIIYANSSIKLCLAKEGRANINAVIRDFVAWGFVWNNSATLTSMKFTGYFDPGTNVQIWAKR